MTDLPKILAIETATSNCSVALQYQDGVIERSEQGNNIHSQVLLNMVQETLTEACLSAADLDAVAAGQGPGSFTGLRIGIGVAQGIAYGAGCSMVGVSSLATLAIQAQMNGVVLAAIDARMGEVYWAVYRSKSNSELELIGDLRVSPPQMLKVQSLRELAVDNEELFLVGNAWIEYQNQFDKELMDQAKILEDQVFPIASAILDPATEAYARGETISPINFAPEYVRNNVAVKKTSS